MGKERDTKDMKHNCYFGWLDSLEEFEQLEVEVQMVRGVAWRNR